MLGIVDVSGWQFIAVSRKEIFRNASGVRQRGTGLKFSIFDVKLERAFGHDPKLSSIWLESVAWHCLGLTCAKACIGN